MNILIKREKQAKIELEHELIRVERQIAQQRRKANTGQAGGSAASGSAQGPGGSTNMSSMKEKKDIGKKIVLLENRLDGVMIR